MCTKVKKPNILLIMSDEHDPAVMGCYGDNIVRTPNLDALAEEGIRMDVCYTPSPLCVPARQSFTAGKYVSRINAWSNNCAMSDSSALTLPRVMNNAGYDSFLAGKMHYAKDIRYGFTDVFDSNENRARVTGEVRRRNPDEASTGIDNWIKRSSDFHTGENSKTIDHDQEVTHHTIEFLESYKEENKPFLLLAGYTAPHFPIIAPEHIYDYYKDRVPMPTLPEGCIENLTFNYKHIRKGFGIEEQSPDVVKIGRELYWALTEWLDGEIGKVIDSLKKTGLDQNTVVIYVSDHGESKGDHGLWWKNSMYEQSARVPCIFSFPARWKGRQVRKGVCSLLDVVKTIISIGEAQAPEDWDGDSMLEYLDDINAPWKDNAISEYYAHNTVSGFTMYREGSFKYVYHCHIDEQNPSECELYDLDNDPDEFCNLDALPQWRDKINDMHKKMIIELGEEPDDIERRCKTVAGTVSVTGKTPKHVRTTI